MKSLTPKDFLQAIDQLGLAGHPVCIHSSMKSFGRPMECGIDGLINAFLDRKCTIMVPSFSYTYMAEPADGLMPERNGIGDYQKLLNKTYEPKMCFDVSSKEISTKYMGAFPKAVLERETSIRGNNALNSFTALGTYANNLVSGQTNRDVYDPLKQLCELDGYVLLMGVNLIYATIIHYAEQLANRNPFIRWSYDKDLNVIPVATGSCSWAFEVFQSSLAPYTREVMVGNSKWVCYKAADVVRICSSLINKNNNITRCGNPNCERCNDIIQGGPILPIDFWDPYM